VTIPAPEPELGPAVDMSPKAIDRRLSDLAQLYALGLSLCTARLIGPAGDPRPDLSAAVPENGPRGAERSAR